MTDLHGVSGADPLQSEEVTAAKKTDWIYHATDARLALLITMHDEWECVVHTIKRVRERFAWIGMVRSFTFHDQTEGAKGPFDFLLDNQVSVEFSKILPDLAGQYSKFELPAQSLCRNYSALFSAVAEVPNIDYCVAITGDTVLLHPYGIEEIVAAMEKAGADVGCSKAVGQEFHRADLTLEELGAGQGGGRKQGLDCEDFMPQLFVVKCDNAGSFQGIQVVNIWTTEQCLGAAAVNLKQHVFSETAYGWFDGVIFNAVTGQPGGDA